MLKEKDGTSHIYSNTQHLYSSYYTQSYIVYSFIFTMY